MRYTPTVNDDSLKNGLKVSAGLHLAMFTFLYFGLPRLIPPLPSHHEPVPFDIVTLAEITNTRVVKEEVKPKPAPPPVPIKKPAVEEAPPPVPKTKPAPPAPPEAKLEDIVEGLKLKKPKTKPKPIKKAEPRDVLGSVLKNVAKMKPTSASRTVDPKAKESDAAQDVAQTRPSLSTRLTISEEDALRRQIEQCWNPPIGARDAHDLIVEVVIDVNPDRTVANAEVVDKGRYASDPFFRAAADAAVRAVYSPRCSPLELTPEKYEQWKRINFTFDPRDML